MIEADDMMAPSVQESVEDVQDSIAEMRCTLKQLLLENEILKAAILDLRLGNRSAAKALVTGGPARLEAKYSVPVTDLDADDST